MQILRRLAFVTAFAAFACSAATEPEPTPVLGSADPSFNFQSGADDGVSVVVVQPDGRIVIGGEFQTINGVARNRIARLEADGSLDESFDPGTGASNDVAALALQPDGKLILGGRFNTFAGVTRNGIVRLNADGTVDESFDTGTGLASVVSDVALLPDGKILVAGGFATYNGVSRLRILRLEADGTLDTAFDPGLSADGSTRSIRAMGVQADGRIVIGGFFTSYDGVARNYIARIEADGSLDTTFDPGSGLAGGVQTRVDVILPLTDGTLLMGGSFDTYDGTSRRGMIKLLADGSVDPSFDSGLGAEGQVGSIALQPGGRILIAGSFTGYNGTQTRRFARLNADGSLDSTLDTSIGFSGITRIVAVQSDGRMLVGGEFAAYDGTLVGPNLIRLLP